MKKQKLATLASCLLALGCSLAPQVPGEKFSRSATAPGVAGTVGLSVQLRTAKTLLDTAHRWTVADINLYRVELWKSDDGTTFADTGVGRDVSQVTAPVATSATFSNLQGGKKYRVKVQAWGSANAATADTLLDTTPATVDYDFTGQDLGATLPGTATVNLDPVGFSGTATVNLSNTPATTASEVVELWSQGSPDALVATQTFASVPTSAVFGGLSAGPTYYAKVTAKDAGAATLATGTSATVHYDPAGQDVEQNATVALAFVAAAPPTISSGALISTITGFTSPHYLAVDPNNGHIWATNKVTPGTVTELSSTGGLISNIAVGNNPQGVAVDPHNGQVWVTNNGSASVTELTSTGALISNIAVGSAPFGVAVDPNNGHVWVTYTSHVAELSSTGVLISAISGFSSPQGVAVDPQNGHVWVTNNSNSTVTELTSTGALISNVSVASQPKTVAVDPHNGNVWVANNGASILSELTSTGVLISNFAVSGNLNGVAVDPSNGNVWATINSPSVVVELSSDGTLITNITTGFSIPFGVVVDGNGHVWVSNTGTGVNTVMELQH